MTPRDRDEFFPDKPPRTSPVVRWVGLVIGIVALGIAGRIAVSHLSGSQSPAGRLARVIQASRPEGERVPETVAMSSTVAGNALPEIPAPAQDVTEAPVVGDPDVAPIAALEPNQPAVATTRAQTEETPRPRIAVVFDDLGYSIDGLARELFEMPFPLTFAVLPGLAHSNDFADSALAHGHEVILHLPMEPLDPFHHNPGRRALLVDLEPEENLHRLRESLAGLTHFVGISNHMGSAFTAEPGLVQPVLEEIKRIHPRIFLIDSRTNTSSVLADEALSMGIPAVANDLFLDGDPARPVRQARRVEALARRKGSALTIGHVRRPTVDAIRAAVAKWQAEGIELVHASVLTHPGMSLP